MKRVTERSLRVLDELISSGTLLDPTAVREARIACRELKITRTGNNLENELVLQAGVTFASKFSLCARLTIENVSNRIIRLAQEPVSLDFAWMGGDFHLLDAYEARQSGRYVLNPCGRQFPFDMALNHQLRAGRELRPGYKLVGLLLGEGSTSTPLDYPRREKVPMTININTENRKTYSEWIWLCVDRLKPEQPPVHCSVRKRRSIFEFKDPVPVR